MGLRIRAVSLGKVFGLKKPTFTYLRGWGETVDCPLIMFVIEGGERPIIVDTGADADRAEQLHNIRMEQAEHQKPAVALHELGVDPEDVHIVVNTHLHWDHSSNNDLFPNARVYVQRAEVEFAENPLPWFRRHFEHFPGTPASWEKARAQIELVDGEVKVAPGVRLIPLPGHTPGSQGVLVETAKGPFLIAGDCVYTHENWEGDDQVDHIPAGIFTDLIAYDQSFQRIEALGCEVIPAHDQTVVDQGIFG